MSSTLDVAGSLNSIDTEPSGRSATPLMARVAPKVGLILTLGVLALCLIWPLADIALRSLDPEGRVSYTNPRFSLDNYIYVLTDPSLHVVVKNTLVSSVLSTTVTLVLAFPAAYLMSRLSAKSAAKLFVVFLIPFTVSILVRLFAFTQILATNGPINQLLGLLGLGPYTMLYNSFANVIGMVNYLLPFAILVLYAGMASIDPNLTTAAKTSGASNWIAFKRIYLPLIRPSVVGTGVLLFVFGIGFFLTPAILGGVGNITVSTYISNAVQNFVWGPASAIGILLLVVTIALTVIVIRVSGLTNLVGGVGGGKGVGRAQPLQRGPLAYSLWALTSISLLILLVPLAIVVPLAFEDSSYVSWPPQGLTTEWFVKAITEPFWRDALFRSIQVGLLSMVFAVAMGFSAARAVLSTSSPAVRSVLMALFFAPMVVPVILLAIGTFDTQIASGLHGSVFGLALAQAVLALPLTMTTFLAALNGFDRRLEQAAWSLGASRGTTTRRILIPMIIPSVTGAALLAFINSWDETTIALFQSAGPAPTLPVAIFSYVKTGAQPTIAAVGTMLIALVIAGFALRGLFGAVQSRRLRAKARLGVGEQR